MKCPDCNHGLQADGWCWIDEKFYRPDRAPATPPKTTKVLLLSAFTMAIWAVAGGAVAFVFGLSRIHGLEAWLIGVACGALHSAQMIQEFKVNRSIGRPRNDQ